MPGTAGFPGDRDRSGLRVAGASFASVALVAAAVGGLLLVSGHPERLSTPVPVAAGTPSATPTATPTPAAPVVTAEPVPTEPAPVETVPVEPAPAPVVETPTETPVPFAPVYVYNTTSRTGLAKAVARTIAAGGWQVGGTANWRGSVSSTTVYAPPGLEASAQALVAQFPEITGVAAATAGMREGALTVVLARDYPTG